MTQGTNGGQGTVEQKRREPASIVPRVLMGAVLVLSMVAYLALPVDSYLTIEGFKSHMATVIAWRDADPLRFALLYFLVFTVAAAISFPGAVMLTMPAGTLFGTFWGSVIVSFASSIGAWLAFLSARYVLRESVEQMLSRRFPAFHGELERDGAFYLFSLRMAPVLPYFVVNLLMGLTSMSAARFYVVSQAGMLAGTILVVNAGEQIAHIHTMWDFLTPQMCISVLLLAVFPWAARRLMAAWRRGALSR